MLKATTYYKFTTASGNTILVSAYSTPLDTATKWAERTDPTATHTGILITYEKESKLRLCNTVL